MMEHYCKLNLQEALDLAVNTKEYNEDLGKHILNIEAEVTKHLGIYYRYTEFEVDFIIRPRIVDDMLIKCFKYDKTTGGARTFLHMVAVSGAHNGVRAARREKQAEFDDIFYYESMQKKLKEEEDDDSALWDINVISELLNKDK